MESAEKSSKPPSNGPSDNLRQTYTTSTYGEGVAIDLTSSNTAVGSPKKNLSIFVVICLGWNICNSWAGVAVTLAVSLPSGGMVTVIYGILLTTFAYICCVGTLAELASVFPTAGGQYHWTSILAPKKLSRGLVSVNSHQFR
jgi:choline transport protein